MKFGKSSFAEHVSWSYLPPQCLQYIPLAATIAAICYLRSSKGMFYNFDQILTDHNL